MKCDLQQPFQPVRGELAAKATELSRLLGRSPSDSGWFDQDSWENLLTGRLYDVLRLPNLNRMSLDRKTETHAVPRPVSLDGMDQFDMRRDALECRLHIIMLEIQQQISPPIDLTRPRHLSPDRPFKRRPIVNRKTCLEEDETSGILSA